MKTHRLTKTEKARFKKRFNQLLTETEESMPLGQKHLARRLGVSTRLIRYWKTGKRFPSRETAAKLLHEGEQRERHITACMKGRDMSRREAIDYGRMRYKKAIKEGEKEPQAWYPPYPEEDEVFD